MMKTEKMTERKKHGGCSVERLVRRHHFMTPLPQTQHMRLGPRSRIGNACSSVVQYGQTGSPVNESMLYPLPFTTLSRANTPCFFLDRNHKIRR